MSIAENIISALKCSLSPSGHLLDDAVLLQCGHNACRRCVLEIDESAFRCLTPSCNKLNTLHEGHLLVSNRSIDTIVSTNLQELSEFVRNDFRRVLNQFQDKDYDSHINRQCYLIETQMNSRIDALKLQLDGQRDVMRQRVRDMKAKLKKYKPQNQILEEKNSENLTSLYFSSFMSSSKIDSLRHSVFDKRRHGDWNIESFYECYNSLLALKQMIDEFSNGDQNPHLVVNFSELDQSIIGDLSLMSCDSLFLKQRFILNPNPFTAILCNEEPFGLCTVSDGTLCVSFPYANKISFYSDEFKLIKTLDNILGYQFNYPRGIALTDDNRLLFCDTLLHRLISTDQKLDAVQVTGRQGSFMNEFCFPYFAFAHKNFIYIADTGNKRIKKLSLDLVCLRVFELKYCPVQIKILFQTALVRDEQGHIYFHDLSTFNIINGYRRSGVIGIAGKAFFQIERNIIYFYNADGKQTSSIKIANLEHNYGDACIFNRSLVVTGKNNQLFVAKNIY